MTDKAYYLGFSLADGIGPKRLARLIKTFGTVREAWEAEEGSLTKTLGELTGKRFSEFRSRVHLDKEVKKIKKQGIHIVTIDDKEYPQLLKTAVIPSEVEESHASEFSGRDPSMRSPEATLVGMTDTRAPFLLYVKGNLDLLNYPQTIGIVGTRKITPYGVQVTQQITQELVSNGFVTISGLAMGVDAIVHSSTMDANGKTIAVLGCGVDCCNPAENQRIYDRILDSGGTIVSTFPVGMEPTKGSFPARNAIIAGLSLGIVVTEGAADSGALITAADAKKIGRPVFAVPGPITSGLSKGPNVLLQQGGVLVTSGEDVVRSLHSVMPNLFRHPNGILDQGSPDPIGVQDDKKTKKGDSPEEQEILDMIQLSPLHFDEIVRTIGKSAQEVASLLSMMELKGLVRNDSGLYSSI